ncbi:hypothetical protein [Catellatospora tritici]|uniref:hypothetical protein n=1 Tax=Catellatospora tritici TaxID=2851566 RepID=UPI001C2D0059|nr:hypothetical protein [Catellatospora tritici]MBV1854422.1 hypothetical protein [Catellatospora tritici]
MSTEWDFQHRPVLMQVINAYDSGACIDVMSISAALGLTHQQIHESLSALSDGLLIGVQYRLDAAGAAIAEVSSVSPMAGAIHAAAGGRAPDVAPSASSSRRPPGDIFRDVVLRATSGP